MSRYLMLTVGAVALLAFASGCRDDAGTPDYTSLEPVFDRLTADASAPKEGPDPFVEGEQRLSLGIFYEGGFSETVPLDGATANYFIFEGTYTQEAVTEDVVEGSLADRITLAGLTFWGGGIIWDPNPRDLTKWKTLAVSLRSNAIEKVNVTMGSAGNEVPLDAATYGYEADGNWHNLRIPLADFAAGGVDLSAVRFAFGVGGPDASAGQEIFVDDVYME